MNDSKFYCWCGHIFISPLSVLRPSAQGTQYTISSLVGLFLPSVCCLISAERMWPWQEDDIYEKKRKASRRQMSSQQVQVYLLLEEVGKENKVLVNHAAY